MTASITSGTNPITDGQNELIARIIEDARKKAIKVINPDNPAAQRIIARGDELMAAIIDTMRELSLELPDLDCFAVADWNASYRIALTPDQVAAVGNFPWSEATLNSPCPFHPGKKVRETHFAFVGLDTVTIMELQRLNPKATEPRFASYTYAWYAKKKFATKTKWYAKEKFATKVTLKFRWYLLLKDIVPVSENKTFDEQSAMLPKEYEVPSAVAETAKDILIFKKTGRYVNPNRYARTADLVSDGSRVHIGRCVAVGVRVSYYWDSLRNDRLGVGASRKFDEEPRS